MRQSGHFGVTLRSLGGDFGVTLGSVWISVGDFMSPDGYFAMIVKPPWVYEVRFKIDDFIINEKDTLSAVKKLHTIFDLD